MIPVYRPYLPLQSLKYAHQALDSGWLSHGPWIERTTEKLQEILNVKYLLLTSNGTTANHLIVKAAQKAFPAIFDVFIGDNTYIAAINSWLFDNYPHKIRVIPPDLQTWNFDLQEFDKLAQFQINQPTFVMAVHNLGNIISVPEMQKKYPKFIFLEDNCEGLFGKYGDKFSGTHSFAASISFFGNKNITCGEGGAAIFSDEDSYQLAKCLYGQGQSETRFVHSELGYNYRLTNVQAAVLYGQLEILSEILERKTEIFERYRQFVSQHPEIETQKVPLGSQHSNWMFGVKINYSQKNFDYYPLAEEFFAARGVEIRPMFYPLKRHRFLQHYKDTLFHSPQVIFDSSDEKTDILHNHAFILPSYPSLTLEEQNQILSVLADWIDWQKKNQNVQTVH